jgi:hypothetical protein
MARVVIMPAIPGYVVYCTRTFAMRAPPVAESNGLEQRDQDDADDCLLPLAVSPEVSRRFAVNRSEREDRMIRDYVESQTQGESVTYLSKVGTEHLRDRQLDIWDVRTASCRYWVITSPTNLYLQEDFPDVDFLVSFHIGLTARVFARQEPSVNDEHQERLAAAWRRWSQAAEALDKAREAEEFQAVGLRCRECLLEFVRTIATPDMVPSGREAPKRSDFVGWSEIIAQAIARGSSAEEVRRHLKAVARSSWQLANWLAHATNATRPDADLAVEATGHVLTTYGIALARQKQGAPNRCPKCFSYRLVPAYPPPNLKLPYARECESCGWSEALS